MTGLSLVDAHVHVGEPGVFFSPGSGLGDLLRVMDRLGIAQAVCTDHLSIYEGCVQRLPFLREMFEASGGRVYYLAVYHPERGEECLGALREARGWPGLVGLKIHPSFHRTPAEDPAYEPAWRTAGDLGLPILAHTWSSSDYNPVQRLSLPERFEGYVRGYPQVRLVLGHAGGRGDGRAQALRMAAEYPQVYLDFAGDIFCMGLVESLVAAVSAEKVLFGSDFPWVDPRAHLTRTLLAPLDAGALARVLGGTARTVYGLGGPTC